MQSYSLPEKWYWFCNQCGVAVHPKWRGKSFCRCCRFPIHVRPSNTGELLVDGATATPFPSTPMADASCAEHPEQQALGLCERCGSCLCAPCVRLVEGRLYCASCVPYLGRRFKKRVLKHQGAWQVLGGIITGLFVLLWILGLGMAWRF